MNTNELITAINNVDTFYEMSDSDIRWELESRNVEKIKTSLRLVTEDELKEITNSLNRAGAINFHRYFKNVKNENKKLVLQT